MLFAMFIFGVLSGIPLGWTITTTLPVYLIRLNGLRQAYYMPFRTGRGVKVYPVTYANSKLEQTYEELEK